MKNFILFSVKVLSILCFAGGMNLSSAASNTANVNSTTGAYNLESHMKQMQKALKQIAVQVSDSSKNAQTILLVEKFQKAIESAKLELPEDVERLPEKERLSRKALYEEMMDHTIELVQSLKDSLTKNDNVKAQRLVDSLLKMKEDGHKEFKADDHPVLQVQAAPLTQVMSLKSIMKGIGTQFKLLQAQVDDSTKNADSVKMAETMIVGLTDARALIPDSISSLPDAEQSARKDLYYKMMDQTMDLVKQVIAALKANDNQKATQLVAQVLQAKKDSHSEFN